MYTRLLSIPNSKHSFFLFGPRGVGKTQWLKSHIKTQNYIDLLNAKTFRVLNSDPTQLESYILNKKDWVIIDEVQKLPQILDEVHRLIESKFYKFILTGSSARKLKQAGVNLLAGRALTKKFFPLTAKEIKNNFDLKKSLLYGHLPQVYNLNRALDIEDYLQSYLQTYLKEEVIQEGIVRNTSGFNRFLEAASFSQGQYLNVTKVAEDAGVDRKVVETYFQIIEDLLLADRLPHFKKKLLRKTDSHPKFFLFDVGVFRVLRPTDPEDSPEFIDGAAIETLIYQELKAMNSYNSWGYTFYCWKFSNEIDVDLVMYGKNGIIAFEIKRSSRFRGGELKGLQKFKEIYPSAKMFYLYGGSEKRKFGEILALPINYFLTNMKEVLS